MNFQELIEQIRFEYYAEVAAQCQDDNSPIIDNNKAEQSLRLRSFYDYLLARGFNRWQLSAHGIGRD